MKTLRFGSYDQDQKPSGWSPMVTLSEGLKKAIEYFKQMIKRSGTFDMN